MCVLDPLILPVHVARDFCTYTMCVQGLDGICLIIFDVHIGIE
jgi:hypothetical protein